MELGGYTFILISSNKNSTNNKVERVERNFNIKKNETTWLTNIKSQKIYKTG